MRGYLRLFCNQEQHSSLTADSSRTPSMNFSSKYISQHNRGGTVKECMSAPPVSWPSCEAPLQYKMNRRGHTRSLLWPGPDISRKTGKPLRPGMTRRKEYLGAGVLKIPHKEMNNREKAPDAPFLTSHPTCFHRRTALTFQEGSAQVSDSPKDH